MVVDASSQKKFKRKMIVVGESCTTFVTCARIMNGLFTLSGRSEEPSFLRRTVFRNFWMKKASDMREDPSIRHSLAEWQRVLIGRYEKKCGPLFMGLKLRNASDRRRRVILNHIPRQKNQFLSPIEKAFGRRRSRNVPGSNLSGVRHIARKHLEAESLESLMRGEVVGYYLE